MGSSQINWQNSPSERVLIIDSDNMMCELLQFKFKTEGFRTDISHDAEKALALPLAEYSMILVDMMDSNFNAIKFAHALRDNPDTFNTPLIIVTAQTDDDFVVDALDAGADDFLAKPFSTRVLIARMRSVLRRRRRSAARRLSNILRFKDLQVDFYAGTVTIGDSALSLSRTEFLILSMFMRNRNQFFERTEIRHEAWEEDTISERAVDTTISRLRKKLGKYGKNIVNRQGFGYGFIETT